MNWGGGLKKRFKSDRGASRLRANWKGPPLKELRPLLCAIFVFGAAVCFWRGAGTADYVTGSIALAAFVVALPRPQRAD